MTELPVLNAGKGVIQEVSLDGKRVRTPISGLDEMPTSSSSTPRRGHVYWTNKGTRSRHRHNWRRALCDAIPRFIQSSAPLDQIAH
jgi:hypothetical protein